MIIAPESDAVLSSLCERYSDANFTLLNSSADSTALVSDKLETYNFLSRFNIPQIPSYELDDLKSIQIDVQPAIKKAIRKDKVVVKPKDGVGCDKIKVLASCENIAEVINLSETDRYIVQPYVQGQSASLSLLCWRGECLLLSANIQTIEEKENSFVLTQCIVNALERDEFVEFSNKIIKSLPELSGYIGVDIMITENEVLLIEINPRLTTSYVGLKSTLGVNPASLILQTFIHEKLPQVDLTTDHTVIIEVGDERAA